MVQATNNQDPVEMMVLAGADADADIDTTGGADGVLLMGCCAHNEFIFLTLIVDVIYL